MADRYRQVSNASQEVRFSRAMFGECEKSRMVAHPYLLTTFNAGDIVPVYCREVLPEEELSIDLNFVIRQTTLMTPTMGSMHVDFYAYWVPNRIVNQSWKAVEGENLSGSWTANEVSLATLKTSVSGSTQIPVGSVADYYDFPTQQAIPNSVLAQCHDLKFRGYVMIWNEHFRDQNYQPPIPMSTLNVYQGFLDPPNYGVSADGTGRSVRLSVGTEPDGSFGAGSIANSLYGSGSVSSGSESVIAPASAVNRFRATSKPLKANKLHDYFTSVLPTPQKSTGSIFAPVTGSVSSIPVITSGTELTGAHLALRWRRDDGSIPENTPRGLAFASNVPGMGAYTSADTTGTSVDNRQYFPSNLVTMDGAEVTGLALDVADIRMASAIQQVYEVLARGGSRYRSIVATFFGVDVDDPFCDIPMCIGHISRDLDLYQTAQTSSSQSGSTPQGNLAAFGYTASEGHLFSQRFVEHGYIHIFAVVRHRNVYASYMPKDNFRLNMLDFYLPQLANISEQPVRTYELNPFANDPDGTLGYQEAWAEYRFEPDRVTGLMRPAAPGNESLALWNYADDFDGDIQVVNGAWLQSNSEEVLNRTLAVTSANAPQFKCAIKYTVDKTLPMPTYSVPGMDII